MNRKFFSKYDSILLLVIFLIAGVVYFWPRFFAEDQKTVEIYADTALVEQIDCSQLLNPTEYEINGVVIEVSSAGARILSSPCPDQICVRQGELRENGDTAVCAPQRVVVKITTKEKKQQDAIVY